MKHQSDDRFTLVRKDQYVKLLSYLLTNYQGLYSRIAPEGFENSPYYLLYATNTPIAYRRYREQRAFEYKFNRQKYRGSNGKMVVPQIGDRNRLYNFEKRSYHAQDLISYEEFKKSPLHVNPDVKLAAFYLYISCFKDLFNHRPIVYKQDFRCYCSYYWDYEKILKEAVAKTMPDYLDVFDNNKIVGVRYDFKTDLTPVYEYIYKLLLAKNIDVMYTNLDEKIFGRLMTYLETTHLDEEADRILFTDYGEKDINEVETKRKEKQLAKQNASSSNKNPLVEAYHNIYGKLMENYPYVWK